MPLTVKPDEVPTFTRVGGVSQWADLFNYATHWLAGTDEFKGKDPTKAAIVFVEEDLRTKGEDGKTREPKEVWGQIASGLRALAKDPFKVKLAIVFKESENRLYVKHNGEYVPMTDEEIAKRKANRIANKRAKLIEENVSKGMTKAQAEKAADEVMAKSIEHN